MTHRDEDDKFDARALVKASNPKNIYYEFEFKLIVSLVEEGYAKGRAAQRKADAAKIPTNWLDPLLTGPKGITIPAGCPDIEKLLRSIKEAIEGAK